jgi:hypothetical protein
MNISTFVQQHYRREQVLSIDHSITAVRDKFIQLSMTDIICGHLFNRLTSRYKLKVRCDCWRRQQAVRDSVYIDGLYGINMVPLVTKITIQLSQSQNGVIITLVSQFPIKYINKLLGNLLIVIVALYAMILLLSCDISTALFVLVISHIFSWLHFRYASKIVLEFLHRELAEIERAS